MVMNDSVVFIFSDVVVDLCVSHTVANSSPASSPLPLGSVLTMTGNPPTILIVSIPYDDIVPAR